MTCKTPVEETVDTAEIGKCISKVIDSAVGESVVSVFESDDVRSKKDVKKVSENVGTKSKDDNNVVSSPPSMV